MSSPSSARLTESQRSTLFVAALAFLAFIVLGIPGGMLGVAWPSIRDGFLLSQDQVGALLLASQIGYITSSFFSGRFALRFGNGRLVLFG